MERFLWVCVGSGLGGGARYLVSELALKAFGPAFPYGTLAVNVIGSFVIGGLMYAGVEKAALSPTLRIALTVGVLGGFTTYSSFSYETMKQLESGAWAIAIFYVVATVAGCLVACMLGAAAAKWLLA